MTPAQAHNKLAHLLAHLPSDADREWPVSDDTEGFRASDIRRVAGFLTMIRQTPLRREYPWTFAAMRLCGIDLEIFTDYAPVFARARGSTGGFDHQQRCSLFEDFLLRRLDRQSFHESLVRDVLLHEVTSRRLGSRANVAAVASGTAAETDPVEIAVDTVLTTNGALAIHTVEFDPTQFVEIFLQGDSRLSGICAESTAPRLDSLERRERRMIWRCTVAASDGRSAPKVEVFEVDAQTDLLLRLVDGKRPISRIAEQSSQLVSMEIAPEALLEFYAAAVAHGLLRRVQPGRTQGVNA